MMNPFLKRATEHLADPEAFLGLVSPEPVTVYLQTLAESGALYDRLVIVQGTPGSGKSTIARLFSYSVLNALHRHGDSPEHRPTLRVMSSCCASTDSAPLLVGKRVPIESEYRDLWELPYEVSVKMGLTRALIQSRAVLGWLRALEESGADLKSIAVSVSDQGAAATAEIGGADPQGIRRRAREVEAAVYKVATALLPPDLSQIDTKSLGSYRPFDVLSGIRVDLQAGEPMRLLVMLDDAHVLHPDQFRLCKRWLMGRELCVSRWMLTRLDVLSASDALQPASTDPTAAMPGITQERDFLVVSMQGAPERPTAGSGRRRKYRTEFRCMAKDMGDRYLRTMPTFNRYKQSSLGGLLSSKPEPVPKKEAEKLAERVSRYARREKVPERALSEMQESVNSYAEKSGLSDCVRTQMLSILLNRYLKRRPQGDLFEGYVDGLRMPVASAGVRASAEIQLLHTLSRPYYFGMDALCDASGENVEQFLRLAGCLVEVAEMNVIRRKTVMISAKDQNRLLRQHSIKIIDEWRFPRYKEVRALVAAMADACLSRTLAPNAPLDGGANAFGILQQEFDELPATEPKLARVLQAAVAYNALSLVPHYSQGGNNRKWCLLELRGPTVLAHGLTLRRGGFIESSVPKVWGLLKEEEE